MKERVVELDYLKCILILLMVLFHLAYFSEKYPLLKQFVYAFHMPVFLILSGYLTNINKGTKKKIRKLLTNIHEDRNSKFDVFKYHGKKLSEYVNRDWIEWVAKVVDD